MAGAGCWLVEVEPGASDVEKEAAIAAHRAATGWTGPVMITLPKLTPAEWERRYAPLAAGCG